MDAADAARRRTFFAVHQGLPRVLVRRAGLRLLGDFVLPPEAWWDDYYVPMEARIAGLEYHCRDDPVAMAVLNDCRGEIDCYRRFSDWYGYAFFVARKP